MIQPEAEASARPRVAFVAHGIHDRGGMERVSAEFLRRASDRFEFTVFTADLAPDLRGLVQWERIRVPSRPIPLKMVCFFTIGGFRLARSRFDLVHTLGAIVPNKADVISLHSCHAGFRQKVGSLAPTGPRLRRINSGLDRLLALAAERWCYRPSRAGVVAAVSRGVAQEMKDHYPGVGVVITPNGVDTSRFYPSRAERVETRAAFATSETDFVAIFVGDPRKGLDIAVKALGASLVRCPNLSLWVVGRGDSERFRRLAEAAGAAGRVQFMGPRTDTERFFRAADVLVSPSQYEAASLVMLEAMASGIPVIATAVNGADEFSGEDGAGFVVARTPSAFSAALERLSADHELCARMGAEGRMRSLAYSWDRSADSVMTVYADILHARRTRTRV